MSGLNSDNAAVMGGYTRHIIIECRYGEFAALIKPDTDVGQSFTAFDTDNQEWVTVRGWLINVIDAEPKS